MEKKDQAVKSEKWYNKELSREELKAFLEKAGAGKSNDQAFIGVVSQDAAKRIEAVCGKKIGKIMIESGGIRHSCRKSSHNLEEDDFLHIVDVVNTATEIKLSDKKHQNNDCLFISKDIGGKITFVMEVRIHYGGWLALVTCYRKNRGGATL
ncbi:MAG: hypothetical protein FWG66_06240 [Spirochaetes bacterium]|nr:hypothetical protein [Spirochaetota bacterium]